MAAEDKICRECKKREVHKDDWQTYRECSNCLDAMADREQERREFAHYHGDS